jgi:photosystem II stability/assembly factor-like uncharacterized protein
MYGLIPGLALLAALAPLYAETNVWTGHGPGGGMIQALAIDPKNSGTLYVSAGTSGVYKSTDGGASWSAANSGLPGSVYGLLIDPKNTGTIYARTGKLFKSTDGGASWNLLNFPANLYFLTLDPQNPSTLYAGANTGVFKSTDGGATWNAASSGLQGLSAGFVAVSPQDSGTLYAGGGYPQGVSNVGAVYRSSDGGATWISPLQQKFLGLGLPETNTCDTWNYYFARIIGRGAPPADQLFCYPPDNRELEITLDKYLNALLNYSRRREGSKYGVIGDLRMLLADPQNLNKVYALTSNGVFVSNDGALSWNDANAGLDTPYNLSVLALDAGNPGTLYAGLSYNGRLFKSTDGGASWAAFSLPGNSAVNTLSVDPRNSGTLYAGTSFGLFKTTDGASSWSLRETGIADAYVNSLLVVPQSPRTLYAGAGGMVFKTADAGATWARQDFSASIGYYLGVLAIDPKNPATLYAGGTCCSPMSPALYKSTDGGVTWFLTGLKQIPNYLLIDPRDSDTLYARSGLVGGGVVKSTDGGMTWTTMNSGLGGSANTSLQIFPLAMDPRNPDILYCIRYTDGQMFQTTDGAGSWSPVNTGWDPKLFHVAFLTADPRNSGTVYAGTVGFDCGYFDVCPQDYYQKVTDAGGTGIFKTTDGGQSWVKLDVPSIPLVYFGPYALAIDPRNSDTLYAATGYTGSVFQSVNGGASWSAVNAGFPHTQVSALVVDGQNPSTVYAGTQGSGVLSITLDSQ